MNKDKGRLYIMEENHNYPFGMKHEKYNSDTYEYVPTGEGSEYPVGIVLLEPTNRKTYQYKFQGQERQDELGLNWDSFKWRNYDYAIGRFMSIDPLAEKYNYQSPYNFSENRVIDSRELEGLEAVNVTKDNPNLVIVALGRAGGVYGDKIQNGQTLYKNLPDGYNKSDDGLSLLNNSSLRNNATIITYAGSDSGETAGHMAQTIANYRETNPNGTVTLIGHSLGGKDVLDAANIVNNNSAIKNKTIDLVMTLEAASTDNRGSAYSTALGENVLNVINFNSSRSSMTGNGGTTSTGSSTTITLPPGTTHTNMDNTLMPFIPSILKNMYNGGNPTNYNNASFNKAKIYNNGDLDPNAQGGTSGY